MVRPYPRAVSNAEQLAYWSGPGGVHWVEEQSSYDQMLAPFGDRVLERLHLSPGRRVLEVGCGTGALSVAIAKRLGPRGQVVAVDFSPPLLARARERAREARVDTVEFLEADAQTHAFPREHFDAVASRFGVMFFEDPVAAFANLAAATRPDGRLVFACWQQAERNEFLSLIQQVVGRYVSVAQTDPTAPGPFSLGDPSRIHEVLGAGGWADITLTPVEGSMYVPDRGPVDRAVSFSLDRGHIRQLLDGASPELAALVRRDLTAELETRHDGDGVLLGYAAWIAEARRR